MREQSSVVGGGGGIAEHDGSAVTGGGGMLEHDASEVTGGGGIAEHDGSAVTGGGGIAEHDGSAINGSGIAEHDGSAVTGGGGMLEHDASEVAGGGGIKDAPSAVIFFDDERSGLSAPGHTCFRAPVNASPSSSPESSATHTSDSIHLMVRPIVRFRNPRFLVRRETLRSSGPRHRNREAPWDAEGTSGALR